MYPHAHKVVFDRGYEFKRDFNPLLNGFSIKPVYKIVKYPHDITPVEWVHQVMYIMPVTKELYYKLFDYTEPWG